MPKSGPSKTPGNRCPVPGAHTVFSVFLHIQRIFVCQALNQGLRLFCGAFSLFDHQGYRLGDGLHILLLQPSGCNCRSSDPDAAGHKRGLGIVGNGVLIGCDVGSIQQIFHLFTGQIKGRQIQQHQMVVRTT